MPNYPHYANYKVFNPNTSDLGKKSFTPVMVIDTDKNTVRIPKQLLEFSWFNIRVSPESDKFDIVFQKCGKDEYGAINAPKGKVLTSKDLVNFLCTKVFYQGKKGCKYRFKAKTFDQRAIVFNGLDCVTTEE